MQVRVQDLCRINNMAKYTLLEDCEVIDTTEKAIQVAWEKRDGVHTHWVPRSVCEDGDELSEGDKDISVATWFVNKEDLPA